MWMIVIAVLLTSTFASADPFCASLTGDKAFIQVARESQSVLKLIASVGDMGSLYKGRIDLNNDGRADTLYMRDCSTPKCSGEVLFAFLDEPNEEAEFLKAVRDARSVRDFFNPQSEDQKWFERWGVRYFSLPPAVQQRNFTRNMVFTRAGKTYIYSQNQAAMRNPPAKVSRLDPDGSIKTLCRFHMPK